MDLGTVLSIALAVIILFILTKILNWINSIKGIGKFARLVIIVVLLGTLYYFALIGLAGSQ